MTEAAYDAALDPDVPDDDLDADELARRRSQNPAERRIESKRVRDLQAENAALKTENDTFKRRDALAAAKADLNAEGPLELFLRSYTGEPTADAIQKAVAADPAVRDLITFTPDERDAAAAVAAENAKRLSSGTPGAQPPKSQTMPGQARIEQGYAERAARKT